MTHNDETTHAHRLATNPPAGMETRALRVLLALA